MKNLYAILFLFLFAGTSNAQKIRFCDTSNKWTLSAHSVINPIPCSNYAFRQFGIDTIVNGVSYRHLSDQDHAIVREDTLLGKVFYRRPGVDTTDQILYDYNWQVGDTTVCDFQQHISIVTAIDSVQINNIWHKVWDIEYYDSTQPGLGPAKIIEGIGSNRSPLYSLSPSSRDCRSLRCFENNGIMPTMSDYVGPFDNNNSCPLSTSSINRTTQQISIVPNPVTGDSKIVFKSTIKSGQLTVFNSIGQKVIDVPVQDITEYKIGDKITVQGLYYFMVTDLAENSTHTGKFVY